MKDHLIEKQERPQTEPSRSATRDESSSPRGQYVRHRATRQAQQRSAGASSRITVRGKSRSPTDEIPMRKTSKTKVDCKGKVPNELENGPNEYYDPLGPDVKPLRMSGLAHVWFDTISELHPSNTEDVGTLTGFHELRFIEGMPDPDDLLKWLVEDRVLVDWGPPFGLVPTIRYVQAGLFYFGLSTMVDHEGSSAPMVNLSITPKGVIWLRKNYVPRPDRHRGEFVPHELRGPIE